MQKNLTRITEIVEMVVSGKMSKAEGFTEVLELVVNSSSLPNFEILTKEAHKYALEQMAKGHCKFEDLGRIEKDFMSGVIWLMKYPNQESEG